MQCVSGKGRKEIYVRMKNAWAGQPEPEPYVDIAQQQMAEPVKLFNPQPEYVPPDEVIEIVALVQQYWWLGLILIVGFIVCATVAWRVFLHTKNQWVVEFRRILGIKT